MHNTWVADAYEGLMLRNKQGPYEHSRSRHLQKYKEFEDDEFEIVGFKEGVGNDKGTIVFKCVTKEGISFDCRPRGTVEYRKELFEDGENLIGKPLTVRYQGYGSQGAPRFGVGISIRDYE